PSHCLPNPPNASDIECTPVALDAGTRNVTVTATDSSIPIQFVGSVKQSLRINGLLTISPGIDPTSGTVPFQVHFTASVKGGQPPLTVAWAFGDGSLGSGSPWSHVFVVAGVYNVTLWVNDSANNHQMRHFIVTANAAPPKPGFLGFQGRTGYYILGAVAGAIVLIAVAILLLRRGRQKSLGPARAWTGSDGNGKGAPPPVAKPPSPPPPRSPP
ncbi:MAG: PKD domain-containing protein, partial [Thermoplasmata archaeon]|nr:PKD domain-containing protein [Thermoplasmata archaeon]